eukprot:6747759-Pyramimonas_sp.AAC.1
MDQSLEKKRNGPKGSGGRCFGRTPHATCKIRWINQTQEARAYSHDGPIIYRNRSALAGCRFCWTGVGKLECSV